MSGIKISQGVLQVQSDEPSEVDPLLPRSSPKARSEPERDWFSTRFIWIEIALFSNCFLAGFDGTVTASTYASISSSFGASNIASWITTSYLLTSTAIQPLYGRFSDVFSRRVCLLFATALFGLGCLGCSIAPDIISLDLSRAVTGIGGGGLMTMTTIINSDLVPGKQRGMYQAIQNTLIGLGAISGASLGGVISDYIGWRICFLLQVPVAVASLLIAFFMVYDSKVEKQTNDEETTIAVMPVAPNSKWNQVDLLGSIILVSSLALQSGALSMIGNSLTWTDPTLLVCLIGSFVLIGLFLVVETTTTAKPIMPLRMLGRFDQAALLLMNVCLGMAAYGSLFIMPLFFQAVLLDSPSVAGLRLVAPSLATPIGGLTTGYFMARGDYLFTLTRTGFILILAGSCLVLSLGIDEPRWKYSAFLMVANFGQGIVFPSSLFAFIRMFEFKDHAVATSLLYLTRSMGSIWGVTAVTTISQAGFVSRLQSALAGFPNHEKIIEDLTYSISTIYTMPSEVQEIARIAYYESCGVSFKLVILVAGIAVALGFVVRPREDHTASQRKVTSP